MRYLLLTTCLLAASQVAAALPPVGEPTPQVQQPAPPNALAGLRLDDLAVTRERPLFAPTRRPPPPPAVEAPTEAPPPAPVVAKDAEPEGVPFELIGSAIGSAKSFVLLRNKATNEVVRLRQGDEQDGWRVGAVNQRSIELLRDGRVETLALANPAAGVTPAPQIGDASPPPDPTVAEAPPQPQPPPPPRMVMRKFHPAQQFHSDN